MRMKPFNVVLIVVLVLMLAFVGLFYFGGTLSAQANVNSAPAAEHADAFASIRNVIESGAAIQTFTGESLDDAANYTLVDITVSLVNRGIFAAEWLDVQLEGATGDVAVYSLTGEGTDVAARTSSQINLKLITRAPASSARRITIQYYTYGISREITVNV